MRASSAITNVASSTSLLLERLEGAVELFDDDVERAERAGLEAAS